MPVASVAAANAVMRLPLQAATRQHTGGAAHFQTCVRSVGVSMWAAIRTIAHLLVLLPASNAQSCITTLVGQSGVASFAVGLSTSFSGTPATSVRLKNPYGVCGDGAGRFYFTDTVAHVVVLVDAYGMMSIVAGTNGIAGYSGDTGPAIASTLSSPTDVALHSATSSLFIVDKWNHAIRRVDSNGIIATVVGGGVANYAGDGGPAALASLSAPEGIAFDPAAGGYIIADYGNHVVRRVNASGNISTIAGTGASGTSVNGAPATSTLLNGPVRAIPYGSGDVLVADQGNSIIRRISAGFSRSFAGVLGGGPRAGDGGAASAAYLSAAAGMAVDPTGGLLLADTYNNAIRRVDALGTISTVTGGAAGSTGDGGPATSARLNTPVGLFTDAFGGYVFADSTNAAVRYVTPAGMCAPNVTGCTVAGNVSCTLVNVAPYLQLSAWLAGAACTTSSLPPASVRTVVCPPVAAGGSATLMWRTQVGNGTVIVPLPTPTATPTASATSSSTASASGSSSSTSSMTSSMTASPSGTGTRSPTSSSSSTLSPTSSSTVSRSGSGTSSATPSSSSSSTSTSSQTLTASMTMSPTRTQTSSCTTSSSQSATSTSSVTSTRSSSLTTGSSGTSSSTPSPTSSSSLTTTATAAMPSSSSSVTGSSTQSQTSTVSSTSSSTRSTLRTVSSTTSPVAAASSSQMPTPSLSGLSSQTATLLATSVQSVTSSSSSSSAISVTSSSTCSSSRLGSTSFLPTSASATASRTSTPSASSTSSVATPSSSGGSTASAAAAASPTAVSTASNSSALTTSSSQLASALASASGTTSGTPQASASSIVIASSSPSPGSIRLDLYSPDGSTQPMTAISVRDVDATAKYFLRSVGCARGCALSCSTQAPALRAVAASGSIVDGDAVMVQVWPLFRAVASVNLTWMQCDVTRRSDGTSSTWRWPAAVTPITLPLLTDVLLHVVSEPLVQVVTSVWRSAAACNVTDLLHEGNQARVDASTLLFSPLVGARSRSYDVALLSACARTSPALSTSFTLTCNGGSNVTLVSAWGGFDARTRVRIGGQAVPASRPDVNGTLMHVQLPSSAALCGTYDCGYVALTLDTGYYNVSCPGLCTDAVGAVPACDRSGTCVAASVGIEPSRPPTVVPTVDTAGLYITSSCNADVYILPTTGVCTNASDPNHARCAFGAGDDCTPCPPNALCPGGFRLWPLPGFFAASESARSLTQCAPPATRCRGWDAEQGYVVCAEGYRPRSFMCDACDNGFYVGVDGTCITCPSMPSPITAIVPFAIFVGYIAAALLGMYAVMLLLAVVVRARTSDIHSRMAALAAWSFVTVQLVAQAGRTAAAGLPNILVAMYAALAVSQFSGVTAPSGCIIGYAYTNEVAAFSIGLLALFIAAGVVGHAWMRISTRMHALALRLCVIVLTLVYPALVNSCLSLITCISVRLPVRSYLTLDGDGSALTRVGLSMSTFSSRALVDVMLQASNPSHVCYESTHTAAAALAWVALVLVGVLFPAVCVWLVWLRIRSHVGATLATASARGLQLPVVTDIQLGDGTVQTVSAKGACPVHMQGIATGTRVQDAAATARHAQRRVRSVLSRSGSIHEQVASHACVTVVNPLSKVDTFWQQPEHPGHPIRGNVQHPMFHSAAAVPTGYSSRSFCMDAALLDNNDAVRHDAMLAAFVAGDFRPSCFWFFALDRFILLLLSAVNATLRSRTELTIIAARTFLLLLLLVANGVLVARFSPFHERDWWKGAVKRLAIALTCMIAALNGMTSVMAQQAGSSENVVAAGSYIVFAFCVCLLAALPTAFMLNTIQPPPQPIALNGDAQGLAASASTRQHVVGDMQHSPQHHGGMCDTRSSADESAGQALLNQPVRLRVSAPPRRTSSVFTSDTDRRSSRDDARLVHSLGNDYVSSAVAAALQTSRRRENAGSGRRGGKGARAVRFSSLDTTGLIAEGRAGIVGPESRQFAKAFSTRRASSGRHLVAQATQM